MRSAFVYAALVLLAAIASAKPDLKFGSDGKFKIVVFADLHYGENAWEAWGPTQDRNSDKVISYILDAEKPDLVIYLGDVVTANNVALKTSTMYWKQAIAPTQQRGIPWASVFGNHDDAAFEWPAEWFGSSGIPSVEKDENAYYERTTRVDLMSSEENSSLSMTKGGPASLWPSVSNFYLSIGSSGNASSPATFLYFLDSGGGSYPEVVSYGQADWFSEVSRRLNSNAKIPELMFWHIPSKAYESVAPKQNAAISAPCVGSINFDTVAPQSAEWGIMERLYNRSSMKAVIVGHNHGLDWCCPHGGLWLCFARHSGYGGYGSWTRGARVIELSEKSLQASTWVRLENGEVSSSLDLMETPTKITTS